jgi:hypothetical protein
MMNIEESNEIIREAIFKNMLSPLGVLKHFDEFGYFKYVIYSDFAPNSSN